MGDLEEFYSFSLCSFVGATLVKGLGGHNPLEPAMYKSCPIVGTFGDKITNIIDELRSSNAVIEIKCNDDIDLLLSNMIESPQTISDQGENAFSVWKKHQGSSEKIIDTIVKRVNANEL